MTDQTADPDTPKRKGVKTPIIIGILLAAIGGGGGFYAATSGLIPGFESGKAESYTEDKTEQISPFGDVAFVPIDPLIISLEDSTRHLRFRAELEVGSAYVEDVKKMMPRIVDVLNSYLRAVEPDDLTRSQSLLRLRTQMLHRAQIILGEERVRDLLIMEFVVN